jgi:CubicO group peptidase (beta-lactamase class C family)
VPDYWPTAGWRSARPEEHGLNADVLARIRPLVTAQTASLLCGCLIVRHGYAVFEEYFHGFDEHSCFSLNSVTKAFTSACVGIALERRLFDSLDQPLANLFAHLKLDDERKRRITLRHALTMTTGFGDEMSGPPRPPGRLVDDPIDDFWRKPLQSDPGTRFHYGDGAELLSYAFSILTGGSLADYAYANVIEPVGIWTDASSRHINRRPDRHTLNDWGRWPDSGLPWKTDGAGHSTGGFGAHFTLRDLAKLGFLYLNGGVWDGRQLFPEWFVAESTRSQTSGGPPVWEEYGYLWWVEHGGTGVYAAHRLGGQMMLIDPGADLIVTIASAPPVGPWALIQHFIRPGLAG